MWMGRTPHTHTQLPTQSVINFNWKLVCSILPKYILYYNSQRAVRPHSNYKDKQPTEWKKILLVVLSLYLAFSLSAPISLVYAWSRSRTHRTVTAELSLFHNIWALAICSLAYGVCVLRTIQCCAVGNTALCVKMMCVFFGVCCLYARGIERKSMVEAVCSSFSF